MTITHRNITTHDRHLLHSKDSSLGWTGDQQALILGSYFWCYPVTSLIGGAISEKCGPRYVVLTVTAASGFLTLLSPITAKLHFSGLIAMRTLLGFSAGFIYPALHTLIAQWVPQNEKGKYIGALMGGALGTVVTWSMSGILIKRLGWPASFYIPGMLTLMWCFFWWYLIANTPAEHPRLSEEKKKRIIDALGNKVKKRQGPPPYLRILKSSPYLAMVVLHFGNSWGLYFIMTVGPRFVSTALGFEIATAGVISALPYLARMIFSLIFGAIGDCLLTKKLMKPTTMRKLFTLFSHFIPGFILILMVSGICSTAMSIALITMCMGSNGAAALTNLQNHQDLAPNFAGTLYGIANAIGSCTGFVTPLIAAYFTKDGYDLERWSPVFFVGGSVYIGSAIFFIFFGTGELQDWNNL